MIKQSICGKSNKMANEENLKPFNRETAVKYAKKGAEKSAEVRRKKRDLKLAIQALLEADIKDKKTGETMSGAEALAVAQFRKAMKGDTKAFEVLRDTSGQKPIEKVEQVNIDGEYIDKVNELKAYFDGESTEGNTTTDKKQSE